MDIKQIREKALLTQVEFAKVIGISFMTVQRWEQGKNKPSFRLRRKILNFCKENNIEI